MSEFRYFGLVERIGYSITVLLFLALVFYFIKGYSVRPRILDDCVVDRILQAMRDRPNEIAVVDSNRSVSLTRTSDGEDWLRFEIGPNQPSGLIVPWSLIDIPKDAKNIGVSLRCAYKGQLTFHYGFTHQVPTGTLDRWERLQRENAVCSVEFSPIPDAIHTAVIMATRYNKESDFSIYWNEAPYFFFAFTSPENIELYLKKMIFIEKQ